MRLLEMATLKTYGARYVKDVWPLGLAWLWTFQVMCQTSGSLCASSPAGSISSLKSARYMGARAFTGTEKWALEGRHVVRSSERPPPGTMEWRGGWDWSCLPQGWRMPGKPGRVVTMKRSA